MCCIISILRRSAHTNIILYLRISFNIMSRRIMTSLSSETMNPSPILIYRNTKYLLYLALLFSVLFSQENPKIYLPFAYPI